MTDKYCVAYMSDLNGSLQQHIVQADSDVHAGLIVAAKYFDTSGLYVISMSELECAVWDKNANISVIWIGDAEEE